MYSKFDFAIHTTLSSSQQAAQVHEAACGNRILSSIKHWRVLPPNLMLLFQSLLLERPHAVSNSEGVNHCSPFLMQRPLPPAWKVARKLVFDCNRYLCIHIDDTPMKISWIARHHHARLSQSTSLEEIDGFTQRRTANVPDPNRALCK